MAEQAKLYGSVKRFGVRYGTKLKGKTGKIEAERKESTKCPYCSYGKAKRANAGIWHCVKCKNRFTGKAYSIGTPSAIKENVTETEIRVAEAAPEAEEAYEEEQEEEQEEQENQDEAR
ncbi:50S ribosomal protein L37ae [Candidatus Woesearchaeota archaeon]|nr:50S ribosomal protein L37ae [Candidatus Woesearchaeota archaeon]